MSEENLQPQQSVEVSDTIIATKVAITEMAPMRQGENKLIIPDESNVPKGLDYCSPTVQDRFISEELINSSNRTGDKRRRKKKKVDNS